MAITDAFTGTDGTGIEAYSSDWEYVKGSGTDFQILSNAIAIRSAAALEIGAKRVGTFPADQYAQVTLVDGGSGPSQVLGVAVRCQAADSGQYYGWYADDEVSQLFENDGATWTQLGSDGALVADGGVLRLTVSGTTLTPAVGGVTRNPPGAQSDANYLTGSPGISGFNDSGVLGDVNIDDFESTDSITPSAAITGTATATIDEGDVVAGDKTIIITLTADTFVPATVGPNIEYVGGRTAGFAGTTSAQTVSLGSLTGGDTGDTTPQAGDLVVVTYAIGSTVARTPTIATPGGGAAYTNANAILRQADNFDVSMLVAYKFMGGTPDTQVTLSEGVGGGTGSTADAGRYTIQVFRGVDTSTPLDVAVVTGGAANSSAVDPGAITPTTTGAIVVAMGAAASGTGSTMTSTLTDFVAGSTADTNDISIGAGYSTWAAGALNPAAFGNIPAGTTANSWVSLTIALRPSVTTPFADARQAIIDGLDSAQAEGTGWNAEVRDNLAVGTVVRTSDTVCTITLSAQAAYNITAQETITVTVPAAALTGGVAIVGTPTFTVDPTGGAVSVTPTTASLVLAFFAPTVSAPRRVTPSIAELVLATFAPSVATPRLVTPSTASLVTTSFAPTVLAPRLVTPTTASLELAFFEPTITIGVRVTPGIAELVLASFAPTVLTPRLVTPGIAELVITGFAPSVVGITSLTLIPGTASLTLTTFAPSLALTDHQLVTPSTAELVLTTFAPTVTDSIVVVVQRLMGMGMAKHTRRSRGR